jgi:transposase
VAAAAPGLLAEQGVGTHTAATLLVTAGDNPERLHSEGSFAHLCGVAPLDASSGKQPRHRLMLRDTLFGDVRVMLGGDGIGRS